jgi:hypothetical protein
VSEEFPLCSGLQPTLLLGVSYYHAFDGSPFANGTELLKEEKALLRGKRIIRGDIMPIVLSA